MDIEAYLGDVFPCRLVNFQFDVLLIEGLQQVLDVDVEDAVNHLLGDWREGNDFSQTSQKFRTELALHHFKQLVVGRHLAFAKRLEDVLAADVGGEDNKGVGEVAHATQTVVQLALVQYLQEEVEHRAVGFLNLIEQHHAVGMLTDLVHQQTAFFVTDIAGRRSVQQGHGVLFFIFRHIETQHGGLVVEEELSQRLGQLGLTRTRGAEEEERAYRLPFLVQA